MADHTVLEGGHTVLEEGHIVLEEGHIVPEEDKDPGRQDRDPVVGCIPFAVPVGSSSVVAEAGSKAAAGHVGLVVDLLGTAMVIRRMRV